MVRLFKGGENGTHKHMYAQKIVHNAHFFVHKTENINNYEILRTSIPGKHALLRDGINVSFVHGHSF